MFCENCYILKYGKKCTFCNEYIRDEKFISIKSDFFHCEHFLCQGCKIPFKENERKIYKRLDKIYCQECYRKFDEKCEICRRQQNDQFIELVNGEKVHISCLKCHYCGELIQDFYCTNSDNSIYGHPECFIQKNYKKCDFCEDYIMDENFYDYKGKMLHIMCYSELAEDKILMQKFEKL